MPCLKDFPELLQLQDLIRRKPIQVYLVGGALRDLLLSRQSRDFDFAVSKGAISLARSFARRIKGAFVLLDEEHGCARVAKKKAGALWTFDFADFRAPALRGDLRKRDFTINTLVVDLRTLGQGEELSVRILPDKRALADLKSKTLCMVSVRAFIDDPLRLLRAYSLMAQLGFKIDAATQKVIRAQVKLISKASPERVREEFFKILESPRAAATLKLMYKDGILFEIVPQLCVMEKVHQGGYHHLDVWKHTLECIFQMEKLLVELKENTDLKAYLDKEIAGRHSRRSILKFACLLHDIGKPATKKKEAGRTSFHGHEHAGRNIARIIARQLMLSTKERFALEDMVTMHLRPGYLSNFKKPSEKMVFRFLRDAKSEAVAIMLLSIADQRATRGPLTTEYDVKHQEEVSFPLIRKYFQKKTEKPFVRLIDGHDLIKVLKLKPGPAFAKILAAVDEAQHLGKVKTKPEALVLAEKVFGSFKI